MKCIAAKKKNQDQRTNDLMVKIAKDLVEFCINESIPNPLFKMDIKTTDGEHYKLIFERLYLDKIL